jgi:hypothetical protein
MGLLDQGIDVSNIEASTGGGGSEPFPAGDYTLFGLTYEDTQSKAGNDMIKIEFNVVGPSYAGRKIWEYFVLNNQVGVSRLKGFIGATGQDVSHTLNTEMLRAAMGKQFTGSVKVEAGNNGNGPSNKIAGFKAGAGPAQPHSQTEQPQQAQATPAAGLETASWS